MRTSIKKGELAQNPMVWWGAEDLGSSRGERKEQGKDGVTPNAQESRPE